MKSLLVLKFFISITLVVDIWSWYITETEIKITVYDNRIRLKFQDNTFFYKFQSHSFKAVILHRWIAWLYVSLIYFVFTFE